MIVRFWWDCLHQAREGYKNYLWLRFVIYTYFEHSNSPRFANSRWRRDAREPTQYSVAFKIYIKQWITLSNFGFFLLKYSKFCFSSCYIKWNIRDFNIKESLLLLRLWCFSFFFPRNKSRQAWRRGRAWIVYLFRIFKQHKHEVAKIKCTNHVLCILFRMWEENERNEYKFYLFKNWKPGMDILHSLPITTKEKSFSVDIVKYLHHCLSVCCFISSTLLYYGEIMK